MKKIIITSVFALCFFLFIYQPTILEVIKLRSFDYLVEQEEPTGNIVLLNLTEEDIKKEGGWPFPRQRLAQIHVDLLNAGAVSVSWVAVFSEADRFGGDQHLQKRFLMRQVSSLCLKRMAIKKYPKQKGL